MSSSRVALKEPVFAAFLAFLVPGLGHLYQRRTFKALLYFVCITGTFFFGMRIGNGKVVYFSRERDKLTWAYLCQMWVGLPALPAFAQAQFREKDAFEPNHLDRGLAAEFEGVLIRPGNVEGTVTGTLHLDPQDAQAARWQWQVQVTGTLRTPDDKELPITGHITNFSIDPRVAPDARRRISGSFEGQAQNHVPGLVNAQLRGHVRRSLWDSYQAPLQDRRFIDPAEPTDLDRAHHELGTRFELGVVYTMIAGLLNILAIYDALQGPAYGDEDDEPAETPPAPGPPEKKG